jgi:hypothetical protein
MYICIPVAIGSELTGTDEIQAYLSISDKASTTIPSLGGIMFAKTRAFIFIYIYIYIYNVRED